MEFTKKSERYASIGHIPGSTLGEDDFLIKDPKIYDNLCVPGTLNPKEHQIYVYEKVCGSNIRAEIVDGKVVGKTRRGYALHDSPFIQHRQAHAWIEANQHRVLDVIETGEWLVFELMHLGMGIRYNMPHEPLIAIDILQPGKQRLNHVAFRDRIQNRFKTPGLVHQGPITPEDALKILGPNGFHGSIDLPEGLIYRLEKRVIRDKRVGVGGGVDWKIIQIAKWVRENAFKPEYSMIYDNMHLNKFIGDADWIDLPD